MNPGQKPPRRISVVVPVYNGAAFIREALDSIMAQTYPVHEIVVVDDGSTDETAAIVASYPKDTVTFIQQHREGPGAARNRGIAATGAELVAFLDADDIWMPNKLEEQVAYLLAHPQHGFVTCGVDWWNTKNGTRRVVSRGVQAGVNQRREISVRNFVGNPSQVLIWRELLERAGGFDAQQRWCEDWELWIRLLDFAQVGVVHKPLITYRWHSSGVSHNRPWERNAELFAVARRAISRSEPGWRRPTLLARAWSQIELQRAYYAINHDLPRSQQFRHSLQALLSSPFEQTPSKLICLARALVGKRSLSKLYGK